MSAFRHCPHCLRGYTGKACACNPVDTENPCAHAHVRYWADTRGAVACSDCGRLFGHLLPDGQFRAFNPTENAS